VINNIGVTKRAHISRRKYDTIYKSFVENIPATKVSKILNVNRNTVNRYYKIFRIVMLKSAIQERLEVNMRNGIDIDESYFVPTRVRGKRGRGAGSKINC
jgi:transposase